LASQPHEGVEGSHQHKLDTLWAMAERDLFANFERMRREMDELFGDVFERAGLPSRGTSPWPAVDVAYAPDPPRAIVTAELAGVKADQLALRVEGRKLILAGRRGLSGSQSQVYQQVEIERGQFRRVIELGADVRADEASAHYEDGMLQVELPLVQRQPRSRAVPIESGESQ
jgi:HSP20 family protein